MTLTALLLFGAGRSAYGALAAVSPGVDPVNGYAVWYQDTNGRAVQLCLDPANCLFDPVVPGNLFSQQIGFGGEAFYWSAEATIDGVGGDAASSALLVLALEAAFLNEDPAAGEQIVFGRVRVRVDVPAGTPVGTWTIDHPFGQLIFNDVSPGIRAINFTEDIGCFSAPCDFSLALTSSVGPLLAALNPAPPAGFLGDGATPSTIEPGPNGSVFRIRGPGGIDQSTDLFVVQGQLFDGVVATPLSIQRANYSRTNPGSVDVFATSVPGASVKVSSLPLIPETAMVDDGTGRFFAHIQVTDSSSLPGSVVTVSANDGVNDPSALLKELVDLVKVSKAVFNLSSSTLMVEASSSDKATPPPTLSAGALGTLVEGKLTAGPLAAPPPFVTVTSSAGGSDTAAVEIVEETLTVLTARRRIGGRLIVTGTSTSPGPGNTITIHLGDASGPVIGTTQVDALGNFRFDQRGIPRSLRPAARGGQITAVSSFGTSNSVILPFP